ncbi:MAG: hypothetical protein EBT30_06025, partial [Verrucomicrobia bacterium]|nr:hypothetical protein [Verrucomicrobiota bacterium]
SFFAFLKSPSSRTKVVRIYAYIYMLFDYANLISTSDPNFTNLAGGCPALHHLQLKMMWGGLEPP